MATSESTRRRFQVDWLISNLRWLLLVSVTLVSLIQALVSSESQLSMRSYMPHLIMLAIAALYNLFVMLLLVYGALSRTIPLLTTVIDTALSIAFTITSGGINSPLLFFAMFPIVTAALRFRWGIAVLIAGLTAAGSGLIDILLIRKNVYVSDLFTFLVASLVLLLAGAISGLVADRLKQVLDKRRAEDEAKELHELRAAHQRSRLVFELASTLSATLNYNKVLEAVLDVAETGIDELGQAGQTRLSLVLLFNQNKLRIVTSRHLPQLDYAVEFEGKAGVIGQALKTAEPTITNAPAEDPELSKLIMIHSCHQVIVVPLRAGFENFGVVVFGSTEPNAYNEDHADLIVAICNQAILALQNAQLYQSLNEEKERIISVEEDARKKLSRDLHDGPTQSIAAIAMRLNYTRVLLEKDPGQVSDELAQIENLARQTTKEIRHMLFILRPLILETQGLSPALKQSIKKIAETDSRITVRMEVSPDIEERVNRNIQGVTFYIIDEAINNARKHARADNIWIRLAVKRDTFYAEVNDDGHGFDVDAMQHRYDERSSLGMINMRERAELINGKLSVRSAPGSGTRVTLAVPLSHA
ncbi:MAG: GAF domain-containing sensor histidine kinase [Anaerolineae bacterium]|nr:GAF domain-containing sensor histidine kinase [Anaerolineae bacterium]